MQLRATRLMAYGRGRPAWTPSLIQTALWLDAADANTITLNGSTVSQWNDKSGSGRNATQNAAANQPVYSTNSINSLSAVTFDGINDFLNLPDNTIPSGDSSYSMFVVVKWNSTVPQFVIGTGLSAGAATDNYLAAIVTTPAIFGSWWQNYGLQISSIALGVEMYGAIYDNTISTISGNKNGGSITSGVIAVDRNSATTNNIIGAFSNGATPLNGALAETIITNNAITTADRQRLEGYLAWKWGFEANLPSGHPYKLLPPTV